MYSIALERCTNIHVPLVDTIVSYENEYIFGPFSNAVTFFLSSQKLDSFHIELVNISERYGRDHPDTIAAFSDISEDVFFHACQKFLQKRDRKVAQNNVKTLVNVANTHGPVEAIIRESIVFSGAIVTAFGHTRCLFRCATTTPFPHNNDALLQLN